MSKKINIHKYLYAIIPIIFYAFFTFYDGAILCDDSGSYINMVDFVEPVYPLLLALFRTVFKNNYLWLVALFQGLLMAFAIWSINTFIKKEYDTPDYINYLIVLLFLVVSLLCRFAAKRSSMYSNSIITEGIAYPLFIIFFRYCLDYLLNKKNKTLITMIIMSFVMVSVRKQMFITLILMVLSVVYVELSKKNIKQLLIKIILIVLIVFGGSKLFDKAYMNITKGIDSTHTSDNRFITTMVFYNSNRSDAEYIDDENMKQLFLDIYDVCDKNGFLRNSEDGGWFDRVKHLNDHYDDVQLETMWPMIREYVTDELKISSADVEVKVDEINRYFNVTLLPHQIFRILGTIIDNGLSGLMITVSAYKRIFAIYAIVIYALYIGLLAYLLKKEKINKYTIFGILTLLSIIINVGVVSATVFCQTRYTIYNMALFYISGLLMLYRFLKIKHVID